MCLNIMNKIVSFLFICLLLADLHAQNTIKIIDKDKTLSLIHIFKIRIGNFRFPILLNF